MTFTFKLARRGAPTSPPTSTSGADSSTTLPVSAASARGIPFGDSHLPIERFSRPYTGALRALWPSSAAAELNTARAKSFRVVVSMAGARNYYTNSNGTFNMTLWRKRIDLYRRLNLQSYAGDGTVVGHYLVDEPYCASCWGGRTITAAQVEEMARSS
jgi:hypothetical protein